MGNEFFDNLSSGIMYKNQHLQQLSFNSFLKTSYTCYSRHNGGTKSDVKLLNEKNVLGFKRRQNVNDSFGTNMCNSKYLSRRIGNRLKKTTNKTLEEYNNFDANKISNLDVVEISSDDSLSIIENELSLNYKERKTISNLDKKRIVNSNGHINSLEFKKRKVVVRLKKLKIEAINSSRQQIRQPSRKRRKLKENNFENTYSQTTYKKTNNLIEKNCPIFVDYLIEDGRSNQCFTKNIKTKTEENKIKINSRKIKSNGNSKPDSEKNVKGSKTNKLKNTTPVPSFETIFVDTVNIDETNSESSPLLQDFHNKIFKNGDNTNNKSNTYKSKIKISKKRNGLENKKLRKNEISKKNNSKIRFKSNNKNLEKTGKIKHCKIKLKNLNPKEIIEKIEESKYRISQRRRSWSVSDVAREHDRRLNFFPEAGPSHIDYYALIKLPVVKPKVPVNNLT